MEARLQRLEMDHEDMHQNREKRPHYHHRHSSRYSQSSYRHHEETEWRRHHHYEKRRQNVAKPYLPYVKLPSFSGEGILMYIWDGRQKLKKSFMYMRSWKTKGLG